MPIIAKSTKAFEPCPAGPQQAVCVDVVDLGVLVSPFVDEKTGEPKKQHKIDIVWQSAELMTDSRPYMAKKRYTLSLHEKSTLRHDLESWRGKPFTSNEVEGFDVERLIGVNGIINIAHKAGNKGGIFANVVSIMPLMKGQAKMQATSDYLRVCERDQRRDDGDEAPVDSFDTSEFDKQDVGF